MRKDLIRKYIWLIDTINQAGSEGITFAKIAQKWESNILLSKGTQYAWRTFMNHKDDVYELFGSEGLRASEFPAPDTPVYGDITYHCRTGEHDITLADWEVYWNAADRLWGVPGEIAAKKR